MTKIIKSPVLSTSFSESGKSAKKRFENILSIKAKKTGVIAFAAVLVIVVIASAVVTYKKDLPLTRSGLVPFLPIDHGTAIILKDTDLFSDPQGKNKAYEFYILNKNDLVYVIYDENNDFYYVQAPVMDLPATQGYVAKETVSFDENLFKSANYGSVPSGNIYKSPNESDIYQTDYTSIFHITERKNEWTKVNLIGGDDGKWVKTVDVSYDLLPYNTDLSYTAQQREVDEGHQPWRLSPREVALDYVRNLMKQTQGFEENTMKFNLADGSADFTYINQAGESITITLYQPVKKNRSGIWAVTAN